MCIWTTCRIWCHRSGMGSEILHFYKLTNDVNAVWPSTTLWAARFYQPNRHRVMKFYLISLFPKEVEVAQLCPTLWNPMESPWDSSGQDTEVGHPSLLQGIFPTQGLNPGFLYCRQILHQLSHQGNPRILEWVAYPFSTRSSSPRNRTGDSCIAGGFFTNWATREAHFLRKGDFNYKKKKKDSII